MTRDMTTKVSHISRFFENWAPQSIKLDYDNVGLLIGNSDKKVSRILTSLDLTEEVIDEAISANCDLIVSHHPLIFKGIKHIRSENKQGAAIIKLIQNDIAAIAAHTNLDAANGGVSHVLARRIGLENIRFLADDYHIRRHARVNIPFDTSISLEKDLKQSGFADFEITPLDDDVVKLEIRYNNTREKSLFKLLDEHIPGIKTSLEVFELKNPTQDYGMGAIGEFPEELTGDEFLKKISEVLELTALRYTGNSDHIRTVAVCGGAGVSLVEKARAKGAQAFVTADIKYHDYFLDDTAFMLLDVGHYESEVPVVSVMQHELQKAFPDVQVLSTHVSTNPMKIFVNELDSKQNPVNKNVQV